MIDVIVLHGKNDNKVWEKQCFESLSKHNVNIIHSDAILGETRLSRKLSFEKATSRYVSFVDIDDYVVIDIPIFDICVNHLEMDPSICGVSTRSYLIRPESRNMTRIITTDTKWSFDKHFKQIFLIHQLTVVRTELIQKICLENNDLISPIRYSDHQRDLLLSQYGNWKIIPEVGYYWRKHDNGEHKLYIDHPEDLYNKIYELVKVKRKFV
jgi:hypothetical protein